MSEQPEVSKTSGLSKPVDFIKQTQTIVGKKIAARENILKEYHPDCLTAKIAEVELENLKTLAEMLSKE